MTQGWFPDSELSFGPADAFPVWRPMAFVGVSFRYRCGAPASNRLPSCLPRILSRRHGERGREDHGRAFGSL